MKNKNARKVDTTKMPAIMDGAVFNNHYPCLCNGKTDVINEEWNINGWDVEFHIPSSTCMDSKMAELLKAVSDETVAFLFIIRKNRNVISEGSVVYRIQDGLIQRFECDCENEQNDMVEEFIKSLISYFGKVNYVEKLNAMNRPVVIHTTNYNSLNSATKPNVEYDFRLSKSQPAYTPKRKSYIRKEKRKKGIVKKIVYKVATWERAGYYRRNGNYVKPCSCIRRVTV